jgi:hypothetical protein
MGVAGASQETRREPHSQTQPQGDEGNQKQKGNANWQKLKEDLTKIKKGLEKEVGISPWYVKELSEVIARVPHASSTGTAPAIEDRLAKIEALLKAQNGSSNSTQTQGTTWAGVAARGMRQAGAPAETHPTRHTVRVQMNQAKGLSNEEILREVKKTITGAAAVRVLRSGDIDVTVPDETAKDRAQGLPSTEDLRIFKRDYLVEVLGVPLTTQVACEKGADNARLAAAICEASKTMAPGLQITWIRWLHNQSPQATRTRPVGNKPEKTRGSLLVGFPTQEMQRRAIRGGLVVDAQLFETRPFERGLLIKQCFKCYQWGHTQQACGKDTRCGQCSGAHDTRKCTTERVSCANCGKPHRAWQRTECPGFQKYYQGIQSRRVALYAQAQSIRSSFGKPQMESRGLAGDSQAPTGSEWTIVPRKRNRALSPSQRDTQRRQGRPTYLEQAARDVTQQRLGFSQDFVFGPQQGSMIFTQGSDITMDSQKPPERTRSEQEPTDSEHV